MNTAYMVASTNGNVENLLALYNLASVAEHNDGMVWYPLAHIECQRLADEYSLTINTVCQVVSAISPQRDWQRNIVDARTLVAAWENEPFEPRECRIPLPSGWTPVVKAYGILNGTNHLREDGAPKTWNFYVNLLRPDVNGPVTIDSHAARAWAYGVDCSERGTIKFTPKVYARAADDYRIAAAIVGAPAHYLQAVTWIVRKRLTDVAKAAARQAAKVDA